MNKKLITFIKKKVFEHGILKKPSAALKSGTMVISDFDFALSLIHRDHPRPEEYISSELYSLYPDAVLRNRKTNFQYLKLLFNQKNHFTDADTEQFREVAQNAGYSRPRSFYSINCQKIVASITRRTNIEFKTAKIHIDPVITELVNYLILRRPFDLYAEASLVAFHAGGMLCSWEGGFPDGNPVVFWPHRQEPQFEDNPVYPWHGDYPPAIAD